MNSVVNKLLFRPPPLNNNNNSSKTKSEGNGGSGNSYTYPKNIILLSTEYDNKIAVKYVKAKRGSTKLTILFSHGNAEDLSTIYRWMKHMSKELNVNIISYDYSGYGKSTGRPSEKNCYGDINAVYKYLIIEKRLYPSQIIVYGFSLGSGPSCYLASKLCKENKQENAKLGGLILHSPFSSVYRVLCDVGFSLWGDKFCNIDKIRSIECPCLIIHGRKDNVVPFEHGMALYDAIPEQYKTVEPYWVDNMGHNNPPHEIEVKLTERINNFIHNLDYCNNKTNNNAIRRRVSGRTILGLNCTSISNNNRSKVDDAPSLMGTDDEDSSTSITKISSPSLLCECVPL